MYRHRNRKVRWARSLAVSKPSGAPCSFSRAGRLGGHTALGADADPTPDGCRTHLDRRPNDDGFIASKDCLVLLLKLTVNREGLELRAITSKLEAPVGQVSVGQRRRGIAALRLASRFEFEGMTCPWEL
jgi:hypothetical protein